MALTLGVAYAFLLSMVYFNQENLMYMPTRELVLTPSAIGQVYEDVWLTTEDGVRLHGWFLPVDKPRATLLFLHGNAGNISHRMDSLRIFHRLGLAVLIIDYRGYGKSTGKPSEVGTYLDAQAAWEYLHLQRGIAAEEIVIFGRSLGAAIAAHLAADQTPAAVILESAFTSAADLGAELYPWLPVRHLIRFEYPTLSRVRAIQAPLLLIHSPGDEIVPYRHAERLLTAANEPKELFTLQGGHNDGFLRSQPHYQYHIDNFLTRSLPRAK